MLARLHPICEFVAILYGPFAASVFCIVWASYVPVTDVYISLCIHSDIKLVRQTVAALSHTGLMRQSGTVAMTLWSIDRVEAVSLILARLAALKTRLELDLAHTSRDDGFRCPECRQTFTDIDVMTYLYRGVEPLCNRCNVVLSDDTTPSHVDEAKQTISQIQIWLRPWSDDAETTEDLHSPIMPV